MKARKNRESVQEQNSTNRFSGWLGSKSTQHAIEIFVVYIILMAGVVIIFIPFFWMISTSLKQIGQVFISPPQWIPAPVMWENYYEVITAKPFFLYVANSFIITSGFLIGSVFSSAVVAYGFARLRFPGRKVLFLVMLGTLMIPIYVRIIPLFILYRGLGWLNTFKPIIVPGFLGIPFFIFLLHQYYMTIPRELDDAAKIDGCSYYRIFWRIVLPLSKPALGAVAIFAFMSSWSDFFQPLIYLMSEDKWPIALGLLSYKYLSALGQFMVAWNVLMGASFLALLPPLVVFFFFQKTFISGIALSGIKG